MNVPEGQGPGPQARLRIRPASYPRGREAPKNNTPPIPRPSGGGGPRSGPEGVYGPSASPLTPLRGELPRRGAIGSVIPPPLEGEGVRAAGRRGLSAAQQAPSPRCAGSSPAGEPWLGNSSTFRGRWTAQRAGGGQRRLSKPPCRAPPGAPPQGSHHDTGIAIVSSRVLRNEASLRARHVDGRDPTIWMRQTQIRPSLRQTAFPRGPPCPSVDSPPS
jgi:hypothetical protein